MPPKNRHLDLSPIDMTRVDFSALESDEAVIVKAKALVRDQLVLTGEAVAWEAWEALRARLKALPGMKGVIIRPNRSEIEGWRSMKEAGRDLERGIVGEERRALEDRAA